MDRERDELITRVAETLRERPAADPRAVARVLSAVWAAPQPTWWERLIEAGRIPVLSRLGASSIAIAALILGFVSRGAVDRSPEAAALAESSAPTGEFPTVTRAVTDDVETRAVPTQFVFEAATASRVSIVGDFNGWEAGKLPLTKLSNGLWTTTVPLVPGRHVYAFVIDDTLVVADPRAPKVEDADFGRAGSVVMVFAR